MIYLMCIHKPESHRHESEYRLIISACVATASDRLIIG